LPYQGHKQQIGIKLGVSFEKYQIHFIFVWKRKITKKEQKAIKKIKN
jgi:hypothetical protein